MPHSQTNDLDAVQEHASTALTSYLKSELELQDAVSYFVKPIADLYGQSIADENQVGDALNALWTALLDIAQSTLYNDATQDRLVSFLRAIKSLPPPAQPAPTIWGLALWSDLPLLGASMREGWSGGPKADTDSWGNLNAFAARLTASNVLDLSLYAIWAMRDALETPLKDLKPDIRDQHLRATALWIRFCGERLYKLEKIWEQDPRKGDVARGGALYSGPKGFCKERWELWRERFGVLSGEEKLGEETRQFLGDAKRRMDMLKVKST